MVLIYGSASFVAIECQENIIDESDFTRARHHPLAQSKINLQAPCNLLFRHNSGTSVIL